MPRRKVSELELKSVWDESLLSSCVSIPRHRNKLWHHLIYSFSTDPSKKLTPKSSSLADCPYADWQFGRKSIEEIQKNFNLFTTTIVQRYDSARGDTTKLLIRLQDGHEVETVIMRHVTHNTVCISSQIGCQMGCKFCATGTMGIIGDLTAGEIIEQVVHANNIAKIRNVVFMGMGEPLNNYENMKLAVQFLTDSKRFSLSNRHVTVSTVGVLKNMYRLSDEMPYVNLALSLHAPNQEVRLKIVPTARAVSIEKLMEAVDYHIVKNSQYIESVPTKNGGVPEEKSSQTQPLQLDGSWKVAKSTGIMIEYILIGDVNDRDEHAHELAQLLQSRRGYVMLNLIPYNPTEVAEDFRPPTQEQVDQFAKICMSEPYLVHTRVRQEKGQDIAGACGQLAVVNKKAEEKKLSDLEDSGAELSATATTTTTSSSRHHHGGCSDGKEDGECCNDAKGGCQSSKKKNSSHGTDGKSAFLEGVLDGYKDAARLPVDSSKEGINISDNSPVKECEADQQRKKHRSTWLLYGNVAIAAAVGVYSIVAARR